MEVADLHEALLLQHEASPLLPCGPTEDEQAVGSAGTSAAAGESAAVEQRGDGAAAEKQALRLLLLGSEKFRQCLKASPDSVEIATELSTLLFQLSKLERALPQHQRVVHLEEAAQLLCSLPPPAPPLLQTIRALNAEVDLSACQLLPSDLEVLAAALPVGAALRSLNLSGNSLSNRGTNYRGLQEFSSMLRLATSVRRLLLVDCGLGVYGGQLLASALASDEAWNCCSLEHLDLSGNGLGDAGFLPLATALAPDAQRGGVYNTVLTSLTLCGNGIGAASLGPLRRVLGGNCSLTQLSARGNALLAPSDEACEFGRELSCVAGLTSLDLSCNVGQHGAGAGVAFGRQGAVLGSLVLGCGARLRWLGVGGELVQPPLLLEWATALRDAVAGWRADEVLTVSLDGCMRLASKYSENEALLPVVELLLDACARPGLELDAATVKLCKRLKNVRNLAKDAFLCLFNFSSARYSCSGHTLTFSDCLRTRAPSAGGAAVPGGGEEGRGGGDCGSWGRRRPGLHIRSPPRQ